MWSKYPEISEELNLVEDFIRKNVRSRNKLLSDVVNELIESGGKRIRPAFAIISSKFGQPNTDKVISVAGALEILHTATLVHDDIIDKAKLRRGRVTVSEKYGADLAVYTGDFLFTKAVLMLSRDISIDKLDIVAKAIKTICEGEVDQYQDRFKTDISVLTYLKRIKRKTAVLFGAACALGAYCSECPEHVSKALARFGFYYGMAFQIRDDLNDIVSSETASGKPVFKDIAEGTITLPVIYAMNRSQDVKDIIISLAGNRDRLGFREVDELVKMVRELGGVESSGALLHKYVERGLESLNILPDIVYKDIFETLISNLDK